MAKKLSVEIKEFKIHPLGASLEIEDYEGLDSYEEFIIALSGPLFNLIIAILAYGIFYIYNLNFFYHIYEVNLTLGVLNLLPAYPLDGAKILKCILSSFCLYKTANKFIAYISLLVGSFIIILGIIFLPKNILNINLMLIGGFIVYISNQSKKKSMYIVLGELIKKQSRFKKRKYLLNREISIFYKEDILSLIGYIEKNRFSIFYILDNEMNLLYKLREDEIFSILKDYGNITLEKYYIDFYNKAGKP